MYLIAQECIHEHLTRLPLYQHLLHYEFSAQKKYESLFVNDTMHKFFVLQDHI